MPDLNNTRSTTGGEIGNEQDSFFVASPVRAVTFDVDDVQPQSPLYIGVDDSIVVWAWSYSTNQIININLRILRPDGSIITYPLATASNIGKAGARIIEPGVEGWILACGVMNGGVINVGQYMYVSVGLVRSPLSDPFVSIPLFAGYVHDKIALGYPSTPSQRPTDGAGILTTNNVAAPGAGADWSYTVPANARQRLVSLSSALTTAVAVANRGVTIVIDDGANILGQFAAQTVQAASLAVQYSAADGITNTATVGPVADISTPSNLFLAGGWRVRSLTSSIQAADQWGATRLLLQEWLDPT